MPNPEILLESAQTEFLQLTTLEKQVLPQIESAARIMGRWAYKHELMTSTKLFVSASSHPEGVFLQASEAHAPVSELTRQNQHYITVEFKDRAPHEIHAAFAATAFGLKRDQKFQTVLTMESPLDKTLYFEKTRGEISFSDKGVPFELIYRYDIKDQSGKLVIGAPGSDFEKKTLLGYVQAGHMIIRSPWPGHLPELLQTVLPRYTKKTFELLLYTMIYSVDLRHDWEQSSIVFARNAFALIQGAGERG